MFILYKPLNLKTRVNSTDKPKKIIRSDCDALRNSSNVRFVFFLRRNIEARKDKKTNTISATTNKYLNDGILLNDSNYLLALEIQK